MKETEDKIGWAKSSKVHWKGVVNKQQIFLMDEICCFDFSLEDNKDWKPEVWKGYNEKGELTYDKFKDEEE